MTEKPIFLLGLGAQKAGTSWLHDYLSGHPQAAFGMMKEYHIFDALHLQDMRYFLDRRDLSLLFSPRRYFAVLRRTGQHPPRYETLRAKLRLGHEQYAGYFLDQLKASPSKCLTGDMTPEYGALPSAVLAEVRQALEAAGFVLRPVMILRDPVARCLSAARMYVGRARNRVNLKTYQQIGLVYSMEKHAFTRHAELRTRYDCMLDEAEAAFGREGVYVGFYEELFSDAETCRLSDWLGIPHVAPDFGKRVNASSTPKGQTDLALQARIAHHYRPVYEDMFHRFGEDRIRALWPSAALIE